VAAEFVSEPIEPVAGTSDRAGMRMGEPGLPGRFVWRGVEYKVAEVLEKWKETGPMKGGGAGSEQYVRKHWFHVRTTDGSEMKLYFERQARSAQAKKQRWWLYTITAPAS
jgi:uncharacterized protein DUF6504